MTNSTPKKAPTKPKAVPKAAQQILSLAMRPRRLSDLYGQEKLVEAIRKHVAKRPPQTWMFHGASGTGKTTLARILSVAYQCEHMKLWGDPCDECWSRKDDFAIHEVNASDSTGIEDVRKLVDLSRYRPARGAKRVFILDEAHKLSNSAVNLLLKPLEEPPTSTVWILGTSEAAKIIGALKRRPVAYQLRALGIDGSEKFLAHFAKVAGVERSLEPLYEQCHLMGVSAPGFLLQALEKYAAGASASESAAGTEAAGIETLRVCKAATRGDWKMIADVMKNATPDDVRYVRASVAGWLKAILARESSPRLQERAAAGLLDLCSMPLDEAIALPWLWATLHKISKRYRD